MRKLLVTIASVLLMTGVAFAQNEDTLDIAPDGDTWVGLSTGVPLGLTAHYGLGNALGNGVDLRFNGKFTFASALGVSSFGFNIGADALFALPVEVDALSVYVGAGPNIGFESGTLGGGLKLGAQALAGAEYDVSDQFGAFGELRLGFSYVTSLSFAADPTLALGVNYHF